ncbi:MAG: OmpH family outer membrane protein [Sphingobacteriales bacterium]|nr:MAG: OmpH family outer membrane protein [Sphingobacteriales bacterium]
MKKLVLMLAGCLLMTAAAFAQAPKLGYINSGELLQSMPDMVKADNDLKALAKTYQDQLETMSKELEKKLKDFQGSQATMSEAVKEVKAKELQDLQARMESTNQSATEKVQKRKEELYKPVLEKADKAIKAVASEKGYDYVFDSSGGGLLFAKESENILDAVKAKLNIKAGATATTTPAKP